LNESARLGRNFASVAGAHVLVQILTFGLSVTLARTLGTNAYGLFAFGFAFPSLLLVLVSAGLDDVIAIDVAADRSRARSYLTTAALVRAPLAAVAGIALWISVAVLLDDPLARDVTLVLGASALLQTYAGTFLSVFRAFEKLEYTALILLVERVFTVAGGILLLVRGYGLLEVALVFLTGSGLMLVAALVVLRRKFVWFTTGVERTGGPKLLRTAFPFALGAVISTFTPSIGPVLLGFLQGPVATGLFNAGLTLLLAAFSLLTLYNMVLLPTMARVRAASPEHLVPVLQNSQRFVFGLGLPAALGAAFYAEDIMILFYGPAFAEAAGPFRILMGAVAVVSATMGNGIVLAASGRQRMNLYVGGAGTAATIGLSVAFIPTYGPLGAALAFVAGAGLVGVLGTIATRRLVVRIDLATTLGRTALAGGTMVLGLVLLGVPPWLGVPIGALMYVGSLVAVGGIREGDWRMIQAAMRGALGRET